MSHIPAYRLDRDVLRQKKAAIGMPQPVTGHVLHAPFALVERQPLPDGLRVKRLPIDVDGEVVFIQVLVKLTVGEPEPVHILFQIPDEILRQRNVADGCLCLRLLFVVAELLGIQPVALDMYDLLDHKAKTRRS